jgi:hypothetical protein
MKYLHALLALPALPVLILLNVERRVVLRIAKRVKRL